MRPLVLSFAFSPAPTILILLVHPFKFQLTSNRSIDKPRIQSRQILIPQTHPCKLARNIVLDQDITLLDQIPNQLLASLRPDINSDGLLVSVDAEKVGRLSLGSVWVCGKGWAPCAGVVSPLGVLYLDNLRARG